MIHLRSRQPGVNHQARAGVQLVGLGRGVGVVEGVEQSRRGDLGGVLAG